MASDAITKNDLTAILQELSLPFSPLDYYPIGAYFETSDSTFDPNNAWGGTWVLETAGYVHVSGDASNESSPSYPVAKANNNSGAGASDGGAKTVTLGTSQIPAHTHGSKTLTGALNAYTWDSGGASGIVTKSQLAKNNAMNVGSNISWQQYNISATHTHDSVGGGGSHENMQPYINVYRWHRTA